MQYAQRVTGGQHIQLSMFDVGFNFLWPDGYAAEHFFADGAGPAKGLVQGAAATITESDLVPEVAYIWCRS
jgi:hypothetical protein